MVDKVQMPNILSTAETTQLLPIILAIFSSPSPSNLIVSLKAFERLGEQSYWRWYMVQFLQCRAKTKSYSCEQGEEIRAVMEHSRGPCIYLAAPKGAEAVMAGAAAMGQPMRWQRQGDRVTFQDSCIGKWGHGHFLLFTAHLLPLPSREEVTILWTESQPMWAVTTAGTFRNVLMAKERYTEIGDLKTEPPQHILA